MTTIRTDNWPGGKLRDFDLSAAHLLPYYPVEKIKSIKVHSGKHASVAYDATAMSST